MLKVGQIEETEITGYTAEGEGVCRIDGCAVFVANALRGERCEIRVTHVGKHSAHGTIANLLTPSPHRVTRACPDAKRCGGCQLWHMDYEEELAFKRQRVLDALTRIGGMALFELPILGAPSVEGYRNKAQYPVQPQDGAPVAGFYRKGTHEVVPLRGCRIQDPAADLARQTVMAWAKRCGVTAYDERSRTGLLRHIYVRTGFATGQVMVCLVVNGSRIPAGESLVSALKQALPGLRSVLLAENRTPGNVILGDKYITLYGEDAIEDRLCGLTFRLSPRSFYQVNPAQAQRLYEKAIAAAQLTGTETVLDLYCGTGTITLAMAQHAGRAIGVELVAQAIEDAKQNALRNGIGNAEFFCADAGAAAAALASAGTRPDVIVVDPPRKGLSPDVIEAVVQMAPQRLVYVSCDPATLARDVKLFYERGYAPQQVEAVDMFPRTSHVECVTLLTRE